MEPWVFDNFKYFEETRRLERPDGQAVPLRPKVGRLLLVFLQNPGKLVKYATIKADIWPGSTTITERHVHGLKDELEAAIGSTKVIEPVSGAGYIFTARSVLSPADNKPSRGNALHVFPGAGTVAGSAYVHSWVNHGANDFVLHSTEHVKWEKNPRHLIMLNPDIPSVLALPLRHNLIAAKLKDSWWSAALPLYTDRVTSKWEPVDLREYDRLAIEARCVKAGRGSPIFLKVRMEDDSQVSRSGSKRQSTDWHPLVLLLRGGFAVFELNLDGFNWSKEAWVDNTATVNRSRIVQVVFGQDAELPSCEGTIEIRDVRLLPRSAPVGIQGQAA
jgi:DNA-binding winged helix-turn-helix (wHTH) protein